MKKTFPLKVVGNADQRVLEAIKNDIRKYVKRERRKKLPEGVDFWDFACTVGEDDEAVQVRHLEEVIPAVEHAAREGRERVVVEILSKPGVRAKRDPFAPLESEKPLL